MEIFSTQSFYALANVRCYNSRGENMDGIQRTMEMNNGNRPPHNRMLPPHHISNGNGHEQWTKLSAPHKTFDEHQVSSELTIYE